MSSRPGALSDRAARRRAVVYQVYPRSFQDSNGDGVGDLAGITQRLPHIRSLGCDAVWISPIFPSPLADFGYDVSDYTTVDPVYGSAADLDRLVEEAHHLGLAVLLDIVPCHTSIEHPWFREHPDWYIAAEGDAPPNNWVSTFGGPAWSRDPLRARWYCHTFYPEQPDLDWRNPRVEAAMTGVMRRWIDRGVDGFRIDALDRLYKDALLRDNVGDDEPLDLWQPPEEAELGRRRTANQPEIFPALGRVRAALPGAFLVAEAYRPTRDLPAYLEHVDTAFCFQLLQAPPDADIIGSIIEEAARLDGIAWMLSNHDFPRLVSRWGDGLARAAAMLLLTLPGCAFIYQGDEIGMVDGPGGEVTFDRRGRDGFRHPMQWARDGGFTDATPWLPMIDPGRRNVADQEHDRGSMLWLYRELMTLRPTLPDGLDVESSEGGVLRYRRGGFRVVLNLSSGECPLPPGRVLLRTDGGAEGALAGHAGALIAPG